MFIIFGFGKVTRKDYGMIINQQCPRCGNESGWQLCLIRKWFTLFFIPVIPYEHHYCMMCPRCGGYREVDKGQFNEMVRQIQYGQSDAVKYAGKTPTQIAYLKSVEEEKNRQNRQN